ncbi:MAG: hypothetical protein MK135_12180 [Polyangiaceae bacterium]|nr:hypothetical protein [Polyangiaceae bacterium]
MGDFTISGTAEFEKRLSFALQQIAHDCRSSFPTKDCALVLGGGYGRGEGGVLETELGEAFFNDLDLVWVHRGWRLSSQERRELEKLARRHQNRLGIEVDIYPLAQSRIAYLPSTLFWYEFSHGHQVISGSPSVMQPLGSRSLQSVSANEWGRMLMNRSAGVVFARWVLDGNPPLLARHEEPRAFIWRQMMKAWLAMGDIWLARQELYHPLASERQKRLQAVRAPAGLSAEYAQALEFKLRPSLPSPTMDLGGALSRLAERLHPALERCPASPRCSVIGLYATIRYLPIRKWLMARPDIYPRERVRSALIAELKGDYQERLRLVGDTRLFERLWALHG